MGKKQIGWYNLKEDTVFRKADFECAAWNENIMVKAGKYPIFLIDYRIIRKNGFLCDDPYVCMNGEIVSDYFGTMFCGNPIGGYDSNQNKGKPAQYTMRPFSFTVGESICEDPESPYELFDEWEVRKSDFIGVDGENHTLHSLYLKDVNREGYRTVEYA